MRIATLSPVAYEVTVLTDDCVSAGKCVASAPGFFAFDDEELAMVAADSPQPSDELLLRIARACPSSAIILTEDGVELDL